MSTVDTALSISIKMAPGPDHRQEPVAPDKTTENRVNLASDTSTESAVTTATVVNSPLNTTEPAEANTTQGITTNNFENKQEEPATLSTLNDSELRALLDEAITYKCPKDREGKSNLFKELLEEVEADETEEGRRAVANSRCLPGSNRRRHKRDSVSERLTHGGSLQNLAQPVNSEFDSSFAYLTSGSSHTYGGGRRKGKKHTGPSVSARQREGGSLPSNVNASHSLASLAYLEFNFDKKGFSEERAVSAYDWTNKEKSKSLDKPSYSGSKREDKDKEKKDNKRESTQQSGPTEPDSSEQREKRGSKGKQGTNEMLESDNPPPEYKSDYMVIDLGEVEVSGIGEHNATVTGAGAQRPHSLDTEDDEGTEMKIIEPRRPVQFITRATFDITQTPVDTTIEFPIREHNGKQDKPKVSVNGTEPTGALSFPTYNSMKCVVGGTSGGSSTQQNKVLVPNVYSVMPVNWPSPNITMEAVSRLTAQHITMKDSSASGEKKSLDENGNAVQGYNGERKKSRRKYAHQEPNVIVYKAETVKGHRNEKDIDTLINFIENKDSKGKKDKAVNAVRVKTSSDAKPRAREKDTKREETPAKLHKSNSLEEISKTKLEDLTAEKNTSSSGASSISSQQGTINVALRRAKQRSTGDATIDCRGDRRSWGTEEGQSIYCNDTGDDYATRRHSNKKIIADPEPEQEPEFHVVTKKKKSKKQRRSSSGSRAQNLANSASYLQRSRGFTAEYRTPLSPELRRKSASSMPPSDKSDSSDLDSVHSLPVTSNSTKHNLTKNATSSSGTPQASYAEIARMATINMSQSAVLNMSTMVPNVLNTASWPSVPSKATSEPDKLPQDYYPSLDELQHSDRKIRQHNFAYSNHVQNSLSLSFEKPPSPVPSKTKNSPESKKAEANEEAINKNIQVFKYVQDIEKMHQSLAQQENKNANSNNSSPNSDSTPVNPLLPKLNNFIVSNTLPEIENNNSHDHNTTKDTNANTNANMNARCNNNPRSRRNYQQNVQNQQQPHYEEPREFRKGWNPQHEDNTKKLISGPIQVQHDDNLSKKSISNAQNLAPLAIQEDSEMNKSRNQTRPVLQQQAVNPDPEATTRNINKIDRTTQGKDHQQNSTKNETGKSSNVQSSNSKQEADDMEARKSKQLSGKNVDKEQSQKSITESHSASKTKNTSSRPPVIMDDMMTSSDPLRNSDSPCELVFGFDVNEELLLSEDSEATPTASPVFSPVIPPFFDKPPPNFDRPPPPHRFDKYPPNFLPHPHHAHPHPHIQHHHHPVHHPHMMMPSLPYLGYSPRFHPPPYMPPTPPPPPGILEKYHHQPKEDFSARYIAPDDGVNVQTYNHDKIVSFVGLAWEAVMREIPMTAATGRVQYYSGQ
ncbi:uncharacterized protein LOC107266701 isoform X2 [Cephus cinctus]|uniref:Uncharacterized protein LOC107266701 isoform X2 n=1 Tax=Cephus cinctus TaxID=211228 RepID=A0AAJ7FI46_CEPCN|nr:uncharacterized protein LOC107266701 isoform X2 [Cephus cinctus]